MTTGPVNLHAKERGESMVGGPVFQQGSYFWYRILFHKPIVFIQLIPIVILRIAQ